MFLKPIQETGVSPCWFRVYAVLNPFDHHDYTELYFKHGTTIKEVIDYIYSYEEAKYSVFVESTYIPNDLYARVRPNSGTNVYISAVPGVVAIIPLVSAIAGALGTSLAASLIGTTILGSTLLATIAANVIGAVIAIGVQFLLSSLFAPTNNGSRDAAESPTYVLSGGRNRLDLYGPLPVILGKHKVVPPYGANPYTEVAGGDQYLRFMIAWGYGPMNVTDIRIGNTPIEEFDEVDTDHDFTGSATNMTLYPQDVNEDSLSIVLDTNFQTIRSGVDVDELGVTITFPAGLVRIGKEGNRVNRNASVIIDYKEINDVSWTSWLTGTGTEANGYFTNNTSQTWQISFRLPVTNGTYDVRVKRGEEEAALSNPKISDRVSWTALRSFKEGEPILLAGVAKSAFRIKATDQLNGVIDQLNAVVESIVPIWNGMNWSTTAGSSNPAALFRYVLKGAPNKRPTSNVDDDVLGDWYDFCVSEGLEFNQYVDFNTSVSRILNDIAAAGKASPDLLNGKWGVVIDRPRSVISQHFTPNNTNNFTSKIAYLEIPHGLRMRFFNKNVEYEEDERIVYDEGFDSSNATNLQVLEFPGITDPDQAYKIGRHMLAASRLRPEFFFFSVDFEHLVATRGDLVRITHDVALIGLGSGRIANISGSDVTLDEPIVLEVGKSYALRVRASDGTSLVKNITTVPSSTTEYFTVTLDSVTSIAVGDLFMFGESGEESFEAIVAEITPTDDLAANIVLVPYSPAVYTAADSIPPYMTLISTPVSASLRGPAAPEIDSIISDESVLVVNTTGGATPTVHMVIKPPSVTGSPNGTITVAQFLQGRFKRTGTTDKYTYTPIISIDTRTLIFTDVEQSVAYDFEIRAIDGAGGTSVWVKEVNHEVIGASTKPPALTTFGLSSIGDHTYLTWTYDDIPIDIVGYEIRYHPSQGITDWMAMLAISSTVPRENRTFTVPSRSGSYAIKAIDILGLKSDTALFVNASLEDPLPTNLVISISEAPSFLGTKTNTFINESGILQLDTISVMADWTTLDIVTTLAGGAGDIQYNIYGTYEFGENDLGIVMTSRVTPSIIVVPVDFTSSIADWTSLASVETMSGGFDPDVVRVDMEIAYSIVDSATPSYSDWMPLVVGDFTARHVKFRAVLNVIADEDYALISPGLFQCDVEIDVPDRVEQGYDVPSGAGTKSIAFSPEFFFLKGVNITAQDLQTGDYYEISSKTRSGFDIVFKNSSGTPVDRTFDYLALGYGQERGT